MSLFLLDTSSSFTSTSTPTCNRLVWYNMVYGIVLGLSYRMHYILYRKRKYLVRRMMVHHSSLPEITLDSQSVGKLRETGR